MVFVEFLKAAWEHWRFTERMAMTSSFQRVRLRPQEEAAPVVPGIEDYSPSGA